ncbi:aldo/keto reductase [Methanobrevibacter sp.]
MQNRLIEKIGVEVSPLGFGAMRLPLRNGKINRELATEQIYHAIDNGVNIIDTAYLYGDSEKFLGEVLQGEYRDKVLISSKLPSINVRKYEDMEYYLAEQLKRLQRDCIDFYLVHSVDLKTVNRLIKRGLFDFLNKAKSEGKIRYVGFSYHGVKEEFDLLIDGFDWDVVMVQYNYFDENVQASVEGIEYAASKGMGVFVMEPLKGGILAGNMPKDAENIFKNADSTKTTAQWALQWVMNNPNISCVFSGMNSMDQLEDNLAVAEKTTPMSMTFEELETVEAVKRVMHNALKINCSTCGYCMPCPQDVNIPECIKIYNEKYLFDHTGPFNESFIDYYQYVGGVMGKAGNAGLCNGCGKCLRKCPQKLDIPAELEKVRKEFEPPGVKYILPVAKKIGIPLYAQVTKLLNR